MIESTVDNARSESGSTHWYITETGCLREYSKDSYAFTLSQADTRRLYELLKRNESLIIDKKFFEESEQN
jgi:hypothetical protein